MNHYSSFERYDRNIQLFLEKHDTLLKERLITSFIILIPVLFSYPD